MLSNKDIRVEKGKLYINNSVAYDIGADFDELDERIKDIEDSIVFGKWTPHIYDYNTKKREAIEQDYVKIGKLYVIFMDGTFDFTDISTMLQIRNLPCTTCVGGTIFLGSLKPASIGVEGFMIQGDNNTAFPRPNVISDDFENASAAARTKIVVFGHD